MVYIYSAEESIHRGKTKTIALIEDQDAPRGLRFAVPFRPLEQVVDENSLIYNLASEVEHSQWLEKAAQYKAKQAELIKSAKAKLTPAELKALTR